MVANHRDGGEISMVVTTLLQYMFNTKWSLFPSGVKSSILSMKVHKYNADTRSNYSQSQV